MLVLSWVKKKRLMVGSNWKIALPILGSLEMSCGQVFGL